MAPKPNTNGDKKIVYPKLDVRVHDSSKPLTVELMKKLFGWTVLGDKNKELQVHLIDYEKNRIHLKNNLINRPIYTNVYNTLKQKVMKHRWRFNGEPMIVGEYGSILDGQHTGIALILAEQERLSEALGDRWKREGWTGPVTIEKLIVLGIKETDDIVNTLNTAKPRSLTDVLFRSEIFKGYFKGETSAALRACARIADYAVRILWDRTGAGCDAFAPYRTLEESYDVIVRHPRLLDAVKSVHIEDGGAERKISTYVSTGTAAGLLYLMGCSELDPEGEEVNAYYGMDLPSETALSFNLWDEACAFWVEFGQHDEDSVKPIHSAIGDLAAGIPGEYTEGGSLDEKCAIVVKAWAAYCDSKKPLGSRLVTIGDKILKLNYARNAETQILSLAERPLLGGIDVNPSETEVKDEPAPTQEEIEERMAELRAEREAQEDAEAPPVRRGPKPKTKKE